MDSEWCEICAYPVALCSHRQITAATYTRPGVSTVTVDWDGIAALAEENMTHEFGPVITAKYAGSCCLCGIRWEPGMAIAKCVDEDRYACGDCQRRR